MGKEVIVPYEIEPDIPIPEREYRGPTTKYPFEGMKVGDSFFVPCNGHDPIRTREIITSALHNYKRRTGVVGFEYTTRFMNDGVRIWRTK